MPGLSITFTEAELATIRSAAGRDGKALEAYVHDVVVAAARERDADIAADEWESIQETLFWLSQPGIRESITEAETDVDAGHVLSEEQIRAEFDVPTRDR